MDIEHVLEPLPLIVAAVTGAAAAFLLFRAISDTQTDENGNVTKSVYIPTMVALQGAGVGLVVQIVVRITGVS